MTAGFLGLRHLFVLPRASSTDLNGGRSCATRFEVANQTTETKAVSFAFPGRSHTLAGPLSGYYEFDGPGKAIFRVGSCHLGC